MAPLVLMYNCKDLCLDRQHTQEANHSKTCPYSRKADLCELRQSDLHRPPRISQLDPVLIRATATQRGAKQANLWSSVAANLAIPIGFMFPERPCFQG